MPAGRLPLFVGARSLARAYFRRLVVFGSRTPRTGSYGIVETYPSFFRYRENFLFPLPSLAGPPSRSTLSFPCPLHLMDYVSPSLSIYYLSSCPSMSLSFCCIVWDRLRCVQGALEATELLTAETNMKSILGGCFKISLCAKK